MPLLDHFHPPLHPLHPWDSFPAVWASAILERFNRLLPSRYFAAMHVHLGPRVEADAAEFDTMVVKDAGGNGSGTDGVAVAAWAPPAATAVLNAIFPDDIEVQVFDTRDGAVLVAVVELVSPGNKDRPEARRAFAAKCAAYLQRGIGVAVVDVVTSRQANLHQELLHLLRQPVVESAVENILYATAYRPARRQERDLIDVWAFALALGAALPVLPLALRGASCVPLDLESTYTDARTRSRL